MKLTKEQEQAIEDIRLRNGGILRPDDVVEEARDESSPLHDLFEWDDAKAAHTSRVATARIIIHSIRIEAPVREVTYTTVKYVRDPDVASDEQGYAAVVDLMTDEERARRAIVAEFARIAALLERARNLAAVLSLGEEVEQIMEHVARVRMRFEHRPPAPLQ